MRWFVCSSIPFLPLCRHCSVRCVSAAIHLFVDDWIVCMWERDRETSFTHEYFVLNGIPLYPHQFFFSFFSSFFHFFSSHFVFFLFHWFSCEHFYSLCDILFPNKIIYWEIVSQTENVIRNVTAVSTTAMQSKTKTDQKIFIDFFLLSFHRSRIDDEVKKKPFSFDKDDTDS